MQSNQSGWKKILRWLPGVIISLVAIIAVLKFIKLEDLKNAFQTVKPWFLIVMFAIDSLGLIIRGKVWQVILGKEVSFTTAFFGVSEGYFLNNVLPFRVGELARSYIVGRSSGKGTFYVLSTVVIERSFDVVMAAVSVLATLPFLIGMDWIKPIATVVVALVIACLFLLFLVARNKEKVLSWFDRIKKPSKITDFILPKIRNIIEGFSLLANPARFLLSLGWIILNWVVWTFMYYFAVHLILPNAPFWWGVFVSGVMALGVAIPSAPSALGVYEASFVGSIAILGGQSGTALAYAILMHAVQFTICCLFGLWGLIREGMSFSKLLSSIGSTQSEPEIGKNKLQNE